MILTFGDSLTEGLTKNETFSPVFHPYSLELQKLLPEAVVVESGQSGEEVGHMLGRLKKYLLQADPHRRPAVVVILGGTNDIGIARLHAGHIAERLEEMHEHLRLLRETEPEVWGGLVHSVAVTVPVLLAKTDHRRAERLRVNAALREYTARSAREHGGFTWLLDIENLFLTQACVPAGQQDTACGASDDEKPPYNPANAQFWDPRSPLHFSARGYDAVGRIVYERLCLGREVATQ